VLKRNIYEERLQQCIKVMKRHIDQSSSSAFQDCYSAAKNNRTESFDVWPVSRFDHNFPYFRLPSELGSFSLDASRNYVDNRSQLRVYSPPSDRNVEWDLSHGYNVFIQRDESKKEFIDHLLKWLQLNVHRKSLPTSRDTNVCKDDGDVYM